MLHVQHSSQTMIGYSVPKCIVFSTSIHFWFPHIHHSNNEWWSSSHNLMRHIWTIDAIQKICSCCWEIAARGIQTPKKSTRLGDNHVTQWSNCSMFKQVMLSAVCAYSEQWNNHIEIPIGDIAAIVVLTLTILTLMFERIFELFISKYTYFCVSVFSV